MVATSYVAGLIGRGEQRLDLCFGEEGEHRAVGPFCRPYDQLSVVVTPSSCTAATRFGRSRGVVVMVVGLRVVRTVGPWGHRRPPRHPS